MPRFPLHIDRPVTTRCFPVAIIIVHGWKPSLTKSRINDVRLRCVIDPHNWKSSGVLPAGERVIYEAAMYRSRLCRSIYCGLLFQ
jgi:hypothetical protein